MMPRGRRAAVAVIEPVEADQDVSAVAEAPESASALTPERARLAEAIANVAALQVDITSASAAVSEAGDQRLAAFQKRSEAERALERAQPRPESGFTPMPRPSGAFWGSQEAYDAHVADEAIPPIPIGEARAALARATDEYDSAKRAEQFHKDRLNGLQQRLSWKRSSITDAVRGVLRADPALLALANEAKRLATRAHAAAYAFEQATGGDVMQSGSPFYGCTKPATSWREDPEGWAYAAAWGEARECLLTEPSTPLPMPEDFR